MIISNILIFFENGGKSLNKKMKSKVKKEKRRLLSGITSKVYLLFLVMLVSLVVVQGTSFVGMQNSIHKIEQIQNKSLMTLMQTDSLKLNVVQIQQLLTDVAVTRSAVGFDDGYKKAEESAKMFRDTIKVLGENNPGRQEELTIMLKTFEDYYKIGKRMSNVYIIEGTEAGNVIMNDFDKNATAINEKTDIFKENAAKEMQDSINGMKNNAKLYNKISLYLFVFVISISFILVFSIVTPLKRNIKKLIEYITSLSQGDFSKKLEKLSKDEIGIIGQTVGEMSDNIKQIIVEVKSSSIIVKDTSNNLTQITKHTAASANEIAASIESIADKSGEQSRSTEFGVGRVFEMAENIDNISQAIESMNKIVEETNQLTSKGINTVNNLTDINGKYMKSSANLNGIVSEVAVDINKIGMITAAITEISEQTNLLALNASIEAARAGEAGRGFSVVADEIRKLSVQTNDAVNQVKAIIAAIQTKSNSSITAIKESNIMVAEQNTSIRDTHNIFKEILEISQSLLSTASDVGRRSSDTANKKDDILNIMRSVSDMAETTSMSTQGVLASVEEQLTTTEEVVEQSNNLEGLAQSLLDMVERFKVN
jgi:methyl-accepting chemotaxis protein